MSLARSHRPSGCFRSSVNSALETGGKACMKSRSASFPRIIGWLGGMNTLSSEWSPGADSCGLNDQASRDSYWAHQVAFPLRPPNFPRFVRWGAS